MTRQLDAGHGQALSTHGQVGSVGIRRHKGTSRWAGLFLERAIRFELAALTLARLHSDSLTWGKSLSALLNSAFRTH
jgi:hypothetical protein